jgi:hypothetical protein
MVKKSTKKFLKKGLHSAQKEQRKKNAWRTELNAKRKSQPGKARIDDEDVNNKDEFVEVDTLRPRDELVRADAALHDMSADEFLSGGFKHHLLEKNDDENDNNNDENDDENDDVSSDGADEAVANDGAVDEDDALRADADVASAFLEHKRQLESTPSSSTFSRPTISLSSISSCLILLAILPSPSRLAVRMPMMATATTRATSATRATPMAPTLVRVVLRKATSRRSLLQWFVAGLRLRLAPLSRSAPFPS